MPYLSASRIFSKLRMVFGVRFFLRMRSRSSSCPMNITRVYFAKLLQRGGNVIAPFVGKFYFQITC